MPWSPPQEEMQVKPRLVTSRPRVTRLLEGLWCMANVTLKHAKQEIRRLHWRLRGMWDSARGMCVGVDGPGQTRLLAFSIMQCVFRKRQVCQRNLWRNNTSTDPIKWQTIKIVRSAYTDAWLNCIHLGTDGLFYESILLWLHDTKVLFPHSNSLKSLFHFLFQSYGTDPGLEITAGQRTMSGLIWELTGQPFVLPVMLTGHIWSFWKWNKLNFHAVQLFQL